MFPPTTKVLVVDDMLTMRKLVIKTCKELGLKEFVEAPDGAAAFQVLEEQNGTIGLVISDWNMPNCTGIEFLKKVRAQQKYATLPFLMVTAEAEQHQVVEAIKAGVSNYVIKPFTPQSLGEKLLLVYKKHFPKAA